MVKTPIFPTMFSMGAASITNPSVMPPTQTLTPILPPDANRFCTCYPFENNPSNVTPTEPHQFQPDQPLEENLAFVRNGDSPYRSSPLREQDASTEGSRKTHVTSLHLYPPSIELVNQYVASARDAASRQLHHEAADAYRKAIMILDAPDGKGDHKTLYTKLPNGTDIMLNILFECAEMLTNIQNNNAAALLYRRAVSILQEDGEHSSYQTLPRGRERMIQALAGIANLSDRLETEEITLLISQLDTFQHDLPEHAENALQYTATAEVIKGLLIARQTELDDEPIDDRYQASLRALQHVSSALAEGATQQDRNIALSTKLVSLEIIAKRLVHAHNSGNFKLRKKLRADIYANNEELTSILRQDLEANGSSPEVQENIHRVAAHMRDIARLLMRMNLKKPGLRIARDVVEDEIFAQSPVVDEILNDDLFRRRYVRNGYRIADLSDVRRESDHFAATERAKSALVHQHTNGLAQTAAWAAGGGMIGETLAYLSTGQLSVMAPVAGVLFATMGYRLGLGFLSEESRSAAEVANSDLSWKESAQGAAKWLAESGLVALFAALPIALIATGSEGFHLVSDILTRSVDVYGNYIGKLAHGALSLFNPETYSHGESLWSSVTNHPAVSLMRLYEGASASLFLYYLLGPTALRLLNIKGKGEEWANKSRDWAEKAAPYLFPGAILLFADLGSYMSGKDDFLMRVLRGGIVFIEMSVALLSSGIVASMVKGKKVGFADTAKNFVLSMKNQKYLYPTAGLVSQTFNTVIGGKIQGDDLITSYSLHNCSLALIQGFIITLGLLPLAILTSGLPKGVIPLRERVEEALSDSKAADAGALRTAYEAVRGAITAFTGSAYSANRGGRIFNIDAAPAFVRALLGWDTLKGHLAFSLLTSFIFGPSANAVWPETSGTGWERRSLALVKSTAELVAKLRKEKPQLSEEEALEQAKNIFRDFFEKNAQVMSVWHPFLPFKSLHDRKYPATSIKRSAKLEPFPHRPNLRSFTNVYHLLMNEHPDATMSEAVLHQFFDAIKEGATDSQKFHVSQWWAITLAMARDSKKYGPQIEAFFEEHPHIAPLLNLDLAELHTSDTPYRRIRRDEVQKAILKTMPFSRYERTVQGYGRQDGKHLQGLFEGPKRAPLLPPSAPARALERPQRIAAVSRRLQQRNYQAGRR